jgi:hypothetical protein
VHAQAPPRRLTQGVILGDVAVVLAIALFAWLALELHHSVANLGGMARGVRDTGTAIQASGASTADEVQRSVGRAADAVGGLPIVGADAAARLRETGATTAAAVRRETDADGARLAQAGRQGERDARATARLIGWFAFLVPTVLLLAQWLPRRLRRG